MNSYIEHIMIGGKSILRMGFILCSIFLLSHQDAKATHIVGGDITYKCLGGNRYEIRLTVRRDCFNGAPNAQFDDPASIGLYDLMTNNLIDTIVGAPGGQYLLPYNADDTLNQILISDCTVVSGDVCVHTTTYVMTIFLPYRPSGYLLAYQRCCRNETLTNVEDPLDAGMTLTTELSGLAQLECNSAPRFGDYPPIYICVNKPIEFSHAAMDMEGDSLVYELCAPYAGGDRNFNKPQPPPEPPYDPIPYKAPYSLANIMGGTPLQIDPNTGALTGIPNTIGQFVVGVCVKAYKNGVLTGTSRRDFQYNVRMCRDRPVADFSAPDLQCESQTVNFTSTSDFADHFLWIFDYGNPDSDTSDVENPTYTYPSDGFYNVALIVHDSMSVCYDTIIKQIGVFTSLLNAEFTATVSECTDGIEIQVTDQSSDPEYEIVKWEWVLTTSEGHFLASTDTNPTFNFDIENPTTVLIVLIVTDENGCTASQVHSFPVQEFDIVFNAEADSICKGDMVPLVIDGNPDLTYTWSPPNGLDLTEPWNPIAFPGISTCYYVTVTDGFCTITDSICVNVQQLPNLEFSYETDCKSLTVAFTNLSTNGIKYFWDFGDTTITTDTSSVFSPTYTYNQSGVYTVTLSSADGCDVSVTQTITSNAITEQLDDQLINCFENSIHLNPDFNQDYTYVWSPAEFLDDASSPNPSATIVDDTWFYVTISQASLPGCEIVDSVLVIIPDFFDISAPDNFTKCDFAEVELVATLTGFGGVVVTWKDLTGEVIGFGLTLTVSPENTTSYVVMAMDSLGCMKADTVTISKPDPTFSVTVGNDTSYCDIQTITLTVTSISGVTFEWFNASDELIGTGDSVQVTPGGPACFYVIGTDPLNCQVADTVCLTPVFFNLDITGDQGICAGEQATICVTDNNGQNLTYVWFPNGQETPCITVQPSETTVYSVVVTNEDIGCKENLSSTVEVFVFDPPVIMITADPDSIVIGEPVQLGTNQNNPQDYDYEWSSSTGDPIEPIPNPIVTPEEATTYSVTVTDEHGCTGTATLTVPVITPECNEEEIFLPNAFTPNNDNENDILYLRGNYILSMEIHIYNRWGEEVFTSNDINIGWDGTYKGKKLEPDVFGYYLNVGCPGNKTYFEKGNITLLH
jgi:gliding motility-associated-like protein